jgi:tRNA(Ile)-lysidine synthetase-like protein
MSALEDSVGAALTRTSVMPGSTLLIAVSGGPDSTALLRALAALRVERRLNLAACIVDHGIRTERENEADVAFVAGLCAAHAITLQVARIPWGECAARARAAGRSLEEMAREMRHRLLREAAATAHARDIAMGHTQDDLVETLLMRVLQGSDPDGLRGIPLRRGPYIRPLLRCTREQVVEYLASLGQDWRDDPTNRDTGFLRNRIRHVLVPVLRKEFPGYVTGLLSLSKKLGHASDLARTQASQLPWQSEGTGFSIAAESFFAAPVAARAASLLLLYDRFRGRASPRRLPWRFLAPALEQKGLPAGGWILKGHGAGLSVRRGRLFWGPCIASQGKKGYFMLVSGVEDISIRGTGIRVQFARSAHGAGMSGGGLPILLREVDPPIVLRSKRKGDKILLEGGVASVKELLAEWKVPGPDRGRVPLLADRKGVLAVLGGALGYRSQARAGALAGDSEDADRIEVRTVIHMEEGREQQQR